MSGPFHSKAEKIIEALIQSKKTVAMTGAGISTASGIQDFRDPEGIWIDYDPSKMTIKYFRADPNYLWGFILPFLCQRQRARPNRAHQALVEMEQMDLLHAVITQNLDGLHQRAGHKNVLEFYGGLRHCYCILCGHWIEIDTPAILCDFLTEDNVHSLKERAEAPRCERCGGAMMPNIPLYDTPLDIRKMFAATRLASSTDLLLVLGTSLNFAPIGYLPHITRDNGGIVAIINHSPTTFDQKADILCRGRLEDILPDIVRAARIC